ncbi:MAG: DUF4011 domain-containing protein, partial [Acutalibacteraceae bacterium]
MTDINTKYELWKNKLLDLGKRNRLLNYKDTLSSTVKITYPDCDMLYNMFVKDETALVFPSETEDNENIKTAYIPNIETNKSVSDLQKTLRNLRNKAKTAIEEQGVNILYLSFGFLNWTESEHPNQIFSAPLILVPVTLSVKSIISPYFLNLHEDEIVLNPTLIYKLENDFGITLPAFDEDGDINSFFEEVKSKASIKNWSVTKDVSLGLLSFLKINMYSDLDKHKDSIIANPIVRGISGDISSIERIPDELTDFDFDKNEKPIDVFQVVDADSSQQDAILMAKKGLSFVLQGPPGTGKSQTITNIIAESLADGKKVLFVSEKMAALDVVHRRLASAGLDDFCLVLHSHKANKRNVLDQLGKVLEFSQKKVTLSDEAYQKLDILQADKNKLNDYAAQIYEIIEPLGKTIYQANGIIANLDKYDDFIFSINDIRNTTKEQYNKYIYMLSQLSATIGKMTGDYKNNPWRNCNLSSVSNEFRHDATSHLNTLIPKIQKFDNELHDIFSSLHLNAPHTLKDVDDIIDILNNAENAYIIPPEWILNDELQPLFDEIAECIELKKQLLDLRNKLSAEYEVIHANESAVTLSELSMINCNADVTNEKNTLIALLSSVTPYSVWNITPINNVVNLLSKAIQTADAIISNKKELLETYEPSVFELDYKALFARIKTEYNSFTKVFKKSYRQDKKEIRLHHKGIVKKITDEEMISLAEKLRSIDESKQWFTDNAYILNKYFAEENITENTDFSVYENKISVFNSANNALNIINELSGLFNKVENKESALKEHYKFLYNGILSDWESIQNALKWAISFKKCTSKTYVSDYFVKEVCKGNEFIDVCRHEKEILKDLKRNISFEYNWFVSDFNHREEFNSMELSQLKARLNNCVSGLYLLEEWIDFSTTKSGCINAGLEEFVNVIEENNILVQNIIPIFKKRFFRLWLDSVLPEYPAVLNFRRKIQEMTISEFDSLDKVQFEIAKARIKSKLINSLPTLEHFTNGFDEISILKKELNKQRRIMPIRKLFKSIPNLLLTLKPCLMMSPLSVSLFLEADTYKFDIVIFDEASQVCTENAIGAISRGKQVVIAGDSKQLPPTSFFQTAVSESDFDTYDEDENFYDSYAYESILDEANMLPEITLKWHYRSRHESLIAFSNNKIYKNNLITFPSNIEKSVNNGVEYIYVADGYYDRGGKKGNVIEAAKVADLVFEHFKEQPNRSLGVIAFGEVQQQAIESAIREKRIQNQAFEPFFAEDREDAFFIKNLENVQGDERDTIIFSIGYAKDSKGAFRMNFGPLSKSGGERRLNVAITRAKYNIKLVGSIMPTDINVDKINSEGPKLLRSYIDFAINGSEVLEKAKTESNVDKYDLPFEEAVYNFLENKGYNLKTQVGCSEYRIDIAVKHPKLSEIYVLGIECDGNSYHSARTARERDRLRHDVLENMGWKIYRVWSADWIKDPVTEGEKLVEAIESAIANYGVDEKALNLNKINEKSSVASDFVTVEEKNLPEQSSDNPYGFEEFKMTDFASIPFNKYGYLDLKDCIMEVVNNEYPIHYELFCQKLAPLFGNEKTTVKIRREA